MIYFKRPVYVRMLTELAPAAFPAGAPPLPEWWQSEIAATASRTESRMPGLPPKLVVTTYAPTRRWITIIAAAAAGRRRRVRHVRIRPLSAPDSIRSRRSNNAPALRAQIAGQEATISELRAKVAQLESSTVGQTREREEVQRTIGDLQAQVARANQELAFFRGIVTQNANSAEVKIQQARMVATATANKFRVRVTLVQPMKPDTVVSGVVILSVDGEVDGKPGRADFATLSGGKRREIPFTFRYLENIEEEITMPPGMKPEQLLVEVRSNRRGSAPVQQSYVWSVDPQ